MLTATQCDIVAYTTTQGYIVCPDCAFPRPGDDGIVEQIIRYSADEDEDGLTCNDCGAIISELHSRYYTVTLLVETERHIDADTDRKSVV